MPREVLFAKPKQRQTALVAKLGLELSSVGLVQVDEHRQTSRPGLYAAGDLTTTPQLAIVAASGGAEAAYAMNHDLRVAQARSQSQ